MMFCGANMLCMRSMHYLVSSLTDKLCTDAHFIRGWISDNMTESNGQLRSGLDDQKSWQIHGTVIQAAKIAVIRLYRCVGCFIQNSFFTQTCTNFVLCFARDIMITDINALSLLDNYHFVIQVIHLGHPNKKMTRIQGYKKERDQKIM